MIQYTAPEKGDIAHLRDNLREEDRREVELFTGWPVEKALTRDVYRLPGSRVMSIRGPDGSLLAMCGSYEDPFPVDQPAKAGRVWFLATPEVEKHPLALIKTAPEYLKILMQGYAELQAWVWVKNYHHIKWAQAVGFKIREDLAIQLRGEVFFNICLPNSAATQYLLQHQEQ